jgi:hypothetical protein
MLSFPENPTNGTEYTDTNGKVWQFDGVRWEIATSTGIKQFNGVKVSLSEEEFLTPTLTAIGFDTVDFDTANYFDTEVPTRIIIPRTGFYRINFVTAIGQEGFGASYSLEVRQNDITISEDRLGSFQTAQYDQVFLLNAGDVIEFFAAEEEGVGSLLPGTYLEIQLQGYTFGSAILPGFEFSGVKAKVTDNVTTTSVETAIAWDDIIFNINANEAGSLYWDELEDTKFTIGTTAYYRLRSFIETGPDGSTDSYVITIKKNGTDIVETVSLSANDNVELDAVYQFTATDYLEVYVENTGNVGTLLFDETYFEIIRLGV